MQVLNCIAQLHATESGSGMDSAMVVRCGLLAKWLSVSVRVRAGARECTFFLFGL